MDFFLFLLLNGVLFVRPTEVVPDLQDVPAYEALTLLCLAAAGVAVLRQLSASALASRPVTLCVIGMLVAILLSHLVHMSFWEARMGGFDFFKVLVYYLLLVATVNTAVRLRCFLLCLSGLIAIVAGLALLQYHGVIDLPALTAIDQPDFDPDTGQFVTIPRLQGTGIFNDPNALSLMLTIGILLCLYWLGSPSMTSLRPLWLGVLGVCAYGLMLTQSRGGLLALAAGLLVLFQARYGWSRCVALAILLGPSAPGPLWGAPDPFRCHQPGRYRSAARADLGRGTGPHPRRALIRHRLRQIRGRK
jgi:hypothetical protein